MAAVTLVFHGPINHPATSRLRNAVCGAANGTLPGLQGVPDNIYVLMSSSGGALDDGLSLYNLFRSLPVSTTTVNMGQIASIANVPFLGGQRRYACEYAYFHFHDYEWTFPAAHGMPRMQFTDLSQIMDATRESAVEIFRAQTKLTDADFEALKFFKEPMIKDACFAKEKGIVHEIGLPDIPGGTPTFNVDY